MLNHCLLFKYLFTVKQAHQVQISASTSNDLSEINIRNRLKLSSADDRSSSPSRKNTFEQRSPSPSSPRSNQTVGSPSPLKSSISAEPEDTVDTVASIDETERMAKEREAAQRKDAERIAREAAARRQQEEADRKRQEGKEALLREKATAEAKMRAETEKKLRMEAEKKKDEELKSKFAELEKSGKV